MSGSSPVPGSGKRAKHLFPRSRPLAELAAEEVPVLLALAPLRSFAEADYLAHEAPGVAIPGATLRSLERAGPDAAAGLDPAAALAAQARGQAGRGARPLSRPHPAIPAEVCDLPQNGARQDCGSPRCPMLVSRCTLGITVE